MRRSSRWSSDSLGKEVLGILFAELVRWLDATSAVNRARAACASGMRLGRMFGSNVISAPSSRPRRRISLVTSAPGSRNAPSEPVWMTRGSPSSSRWPRVPAQRELVSRRTVLRERRDGFGRRLVGRRRSREAHAGRGEVLPDQLAVCIAPIAVCNRVGTSSRARPSATFAGDPPGWRETTPAIDDLVDERLPDDERAGAHDGTRASTLSRPSDPLDGLRVGDLADPAASRRRCGTRAAATVPRDPAPAGRRRVARR